MDNNLGHRADTYRSCSPVTGSLRANSGNPGANCVRPLAAVRLLRPAARTLALCAWLLVVALATPAAALAHGLVGRVYLPVPTWLFAWAAGAVLVISFMLL